MDAARPRVRVHVVGLDDDQRMLLSRRPHTRMWTLPWRYLKTNEDPARLARTLIGDTGAAPVRPRILDVDSAAELGDHFIDLTFQCSAKRVWRTAPAEASALWWSLDEITSLELTTRAKSALVNAWPQFWPHV